jgi:hypothetical protein
MHLLDSGYDWDYPVEPQERGKSFLRHARGNWRPGPTPPPTTRSSTPKLPSVNFNISVMTMAEKWADLILQL